MSFQKSEGIWRHDPDSTGVGGQHLDTNFNALAALKQAVRPVLSPVVPYSAVQPFFEACQVRRCDIAVIADSNAFIDSVGSELAAPYAWCKRFGWYATGVHASNAVSNYTRDYRANYGSGATFDSIPAWDTTFGWGQVPGEMYVAGSFGDSWTHVFLSIAVDHPMANAKMTWRFRHDLHGSGVIEPACRKASTLTYLATDSISGTSGMTEGTLEVDAGVRDTDLWFSFQGVSGSATGPFYSNYQRLEFPDALTGVAVSLMFGQGGVGTRIAAEAIQAMTQTQFNEWASAVVEPQGDDGPHMLMVQIIEGANDFADSATSVGPNPTASNTPEGVVDNHVAIVEGIRTLWAGADYDPDQLYFLIGPYHPQEYSRPDWGLDLDAALEVYALSETNIASVSRSRLDHSVRFSSLNRYNGVYPDDAHLKGKAYYDWWDELVAAIVPHVRPPVAEIETFKSITLTGGTGVVPFAVLDATNAPTVQIDATNQFAFSIASGGPIYFGAFSNPANNRAGFSTPGKVLFALDAATSRIGIGRGPLGYNFAVSAPDACFHVWGGADEIQQIVQGHTSQSANLTEWRDTADAVLAYVSATGAINTAVEYRVGGTKVLGAQSAPIADATDGTDVILRLNDLLLALRTHGMIGT